MSRSVIFLDIEGVLVTRRDIPVLAVPGLAQKLADQYNLPELATLSDLLVAQILAHFDEKACSFIETLCEQRQAEIVLTSSWRHFHSLSQLKAIFALLGMHHLRDTVSSGCVRRDVIQSYLHTHKISSYIVVDDMDLSRVFGYRFIHCQKGFHEKQLQQALSAFACQQSFPLKSKFHPEPASEAGLLYAA